MVKSWLRKHDEIMSENIVEIMSEQAWWNHVWTNIVKTSSLKKHSTAMWVIWGKITDYKLCYELPVPYIPSHHLLYTPSLDATGSVPSNSQSEARKAEQALLLAEEHWTSTVIGWQALEKHCHWLIIKVITTGQTEWQNEWQNEWQTLPLVSLLFAGNNEPVIGAR